MDESGVFADAELAAFIEEGRANPAPSVRGIGVDAARKAAWARTAARPAGPEVALVEDLVLDIASRCPARLYRPFASVVPLVCYLHGGGWTIGDVSTHDRICRRLCSLAGVAVLSLEYRLALAHPWPAALDDATAMVRVVRRDPDRFGSPTSLGVAGDSAGGHLAALACLELRGNDDAPDAQVLIYPNTDLTFSEPSVIEKGSGWGLSGDDALFFAEQWVPDASRRADGRVSPLFAPDLSGLPPAIVVVAEHDPLRDEGEAYAARLLAAGVEVEVRREAGLVHGFLSFDVISPAAKAGGDRVFSETGALLRQVATS